MSGSASGPTGNGGAPPASGLSEVVPAARRWREYGARPSRWRWLLLGEHQEPPVSYLGPVIQPDAANPVVGVCCSGGGIRSASFNLGVLQAIQQAGRLEKVKYLAAVSGGSYIAAAFAMVAKNDGPDDSDPALVTREHPAFERGSPEEQYLRNRASYMAPTGAGKLLLAWRVVLGLLVNLVLIAAVVTLVAALLALYYRAADPGLIRPPGEHIAVGASPNGTVWGAGLVVSAVALVLGAAAIVVRSDKRDVLRSVEIWSLRLFLLGLAIFALELVVPVLIDVMRHNKTSSDDVRHTRTVGAGVSATVATIIGTILLELRSLVREPVKAGEEVKSRLGKLSSRARMTLVYLAAGVLGPLLVVAMLVAGAMVQVENTSLLVRLGVPTAAFLVLVLVSRLGDLNAWSLHPFYRQRLCTAFALRRVRRGGDPPAGRAEPRPEPELMPLSKTKVAPHDGSAWPTLIVCAAANVSDPGASPPGRGVTSFTFSYDEMGGPLVGGVKTKKFVGALSRTRRRDFSLPAVVAMSGAAISPSMGKQTRPSVRFLLGMANVRLGVWIPNPRRRESFVRMRAAIGSNVGQGPVSKLWAMRVRTVKRADAERAEALDEAHRKTFSVPRPTPRYLLKELLGWTSINDKFLYVTDGGHYENLGLVELLRRGCTQVYCFDASGGKPKGQLGDAIALARSELGVEIDFPDGQLEGLDETGGIAKAACATGTLRYTWSTPEVTGTIVYAPTVMTPEVPWDVKAFRNEDPQFPHHSTMDQLFTDQKFEAYRVLGCCAANSAMAAMDEATATGEVVLAPAPNGGPSPRRRMLLWVGKES
jgi:hypothetical protein